MRQAARVDANHAAIVDAFRRLGWSVQSLAAVGKGCPDLLVAKRGHTLVVEVKTAKGKLNADQRAWVEAWQASVFVLQSVDDVIRLNAHADDRASSGPFLPTFKLVPRVWRKVDDPADHGSV